jgi:serine/threonine protein kinase
VKLVDFGTSCFEGKQIYQYLQSRYYRAPEIILRQPYSFPIDMWSVGCLLAELRTGEPLFAGTSDVEQLMYFVNAIGMPMK